MPRFQWGNIPSPKLVHIHTLFCYSPSTQQIHSCIKHHTIVFDVFKFRDCKLQSYSPTQKLTKEISQENNSTTALAGALYSMGGSGYCGFAF